MVSRHLRSAYPAALLLSLLLSACGGGGADSASSQPLPTQQTLPANTQNSTTALFTPGDAVPAPVLINDTATDGFNRFNYRRQQMGLASVSRNSNIDVAAQGHSNYQKINDTITHVQIGGKSGFTGAEVLDRLTAAQYRFTSTTGYAYGEVISASGDLAGQNNAEDLITAIYHRYVTFEPKFREAGAGSAGLSATGYNFFTVDFAANGLTGGIGKAQIALYPYANQTGITTVFPHKQETPDPVPDLQQTYVGYPVSVHADGDTDVTVKSFTIQPRGGQVLPVRLLSYATDPGDMIEGRTPPSAASIIPLSPLLSGTTYDVQFIGSVSGAPVARVWSFTTR
jgi:uncharacterized protein YkwD